MANVINNTVIGHFGDLTFFRSSIPPMINAVFNNARITMVILDNSATAMTGFQPHPGTGFRARGEESLKLKPEDIARACGVKFVEVVDPFDVKKTIEIMEKAIRFEGPSVVVSRRLCNILEQREKKRRGERVIPYHVEHEKCSHCQFCVKSLGCPAIIIEDDKIIVDVSQCAGCGLCAQICPKDAIIQDEGN